MNGDPMAPPPGGYQQEQGPIRTPGMVIAGFLLSFCCCPLGLLFSIIGLNEVKRSEGRLGGEGLAVAGIVISILGMLLGIAWRVLLR